MTQNKDTAQKHHSAKKPRFLTQFQHSIQSLIHPAKFTKGRQFSCALGELEREDWLAACLPQFAQVRERTTPQGEALVSQGLWNTENTRGKNLNLILEVCSGNPEAQREDGGGRDRESGRRNRKKEGKQKGIFQLVMTRDGTLGNTREEEESGTLSIQEHYWYGRWVGELLQRAVRGITRHLAALTPPPSSPIC